MARYMVKPRIRPPVTGGGGAAAILSLALATHNYACTRTFRSPANPTPPCGSPDVTSRPFCVSGVRFLNRALENPCHNPPSFSESTLVQLGGDGNAHLWHAR